ncbi:MAG: A24 family peptidase [Methylovirgula sp.]
MSLFVVHVISWAASVIILAVAAATDLKKRLIFNELVAAVAVIALVQGIITRPALVWLSLIAAVFLFCVLGVLGHYKIIGGGDVKLIAAVTLLVPPEHIGQLLVDIALAGGLLSGVYFLAHHAFKTRAPQSIAAENGSSASAFCCMTKPEFGRISPAYTIPYAVAIFVGVSSYAAHEFFQCFYATSCSL